MLKTKTALTISLLFTSTCLMADDLLPGPGEADANFKSAKEKISYALGMDIGKSMSNNDLDLDLDQLIRGIRDTVSADGKPLLSDKQLQETILAFQQELQKKAMAERQAAAAENKKKGAAFLAQNRNKPGVKTLASGLQYKIERRGTGSVPKATDKVRTHYKGTLIDGTVFDSSYERGRPAEFPVGGVIRGWTEALQLMPVGSKWTLYVPSQMAYGERGAGNDIGPNETLIFEIELLGIVQ